MKKKVFINGRFTTHHFAIRNVIYSITKELSKKDDLEVFITINKNSDKKDFEKLDVNIINVNINSDSSILNNLYTIFIVPLLLIKYRINLCIYPGISLFLFKPCKTILYMHDLIEYQMDNQSKKQLIFRKITYPYVCKLANKIVTVSKNSKKDLESILNVKSEKISVFYNGFDDDIYPVEKQAAAKYVEEKYQISNYIYYMGYITHPQKNLIYLINEFKILHENNKDLNLVFAGPIGKDSDLIFNAVKDNNLESSFKYLGKVPYEHIKYLYSASICFCFPSLYEGFGMPVLESMATKTITFASNISSIPEILTNENYLIDPRKKGDLSDCIQKHFQISDVKKEEVVEKNYQRTKAFSWENHGDSLHKLILKLL